MTSLFLALSIFIMPFSLLAARSVKCIDGRSIEIYMRPAFATVINFPVKPEQVVIGGKSQVSVEYIKNDLAITPLSSNSSTNIFVYLLGRRCGFNLRISSANFDSLVLVKDPDEAKMKVRFE